MQSNLFTQMNLSGEMMRAVEELGFEEATSIQAASIPLIMEGRDVIGHSQTGTGKTAAFSIPAIEMVDASKARTVQILILCPTRELAVQACDEIKKFAKYKRGIKAIPIYGGQQIDRQFASLRQGAQIVVGTPGRVMDHMRRGTLKLDALSMIILDEADEMLSMGFREDIETILKDVPEKRQTILFSATMSKEILAITRKYQTDPEMIKNTKTELTVSNIEQSYYDVPSGKKIEVLSRLLDTHNPKRSMIFCNTKSMVEELTGQLQLRGYSAGALHGDIKQSSRTQIMNSFKNGGIDILVATDVAARGIDVDDIEAVFNFDIPQDVEYYVHRIGRTGRAGKNGYSFTFVSGRRQMQELINIQDYTKSTISLKRVPSYDEVMETRAQQFIEETKAEINSGGLHQYNKIVDALLDEFSSVDILSALVKMNMSKDGKENVPNRSDDAAFTAETNRRKRDRGLEPERKKRNGARVKAEPRVYNEENMTKLTISIGRNHRVSASHILGAIAGESGLPGKAFGRIEISDKQTTISVPNEHVNNLLKCMRNCKIMGYRTTTKKA